jgi:hypothetical protein
MNHTTINHENKMITILLCQFGVEAVEKCFIYSHAGLKSSIHMPVLSRNC